MVEAGERTGRRIIEAFHDHYHPVFLYLKDLVASGSLGRLTSLRAVFNNTIPPVEDDFRRTATMGGGVLREFGCYPVHWCRSLVGEEPEVVSAEATLTKDGVDEDTTALLRFPSGVLAEIEARMSPGWNMYARLYIEGDRGSVEAINSLLPHRGHSIIERIDGGLREHTLAGGTTFDYQLAMLVEALTNGRPLPTEGADPIDNMATIDAIYAAAGIGRH